MAGFSARKLTPPLRCAINKTVDIIKQLPIRKKITGIVLIVTFLCLAAGLTLMILYQYQASRISFLEKIQQQASLVGEFASGPSGRISRRSAEPALSALRTHPFVLSGAVYDAGKNMVAVYNSEEEPVISFPPQAEAEFQFHENFLDVIQPIFLDSRRQGYVFLRASTESLKRNIVPYIIAAAVLFLLLMPVSYILARQFQKTVSRPIEKLIRTTQKISGPGETFRQFKKKQRNEIQLLQNRIDYLIEIADFREMNLDKVKETQQQYETAQEFLTRYREYFEHSAAGQIVLKTEDKGKNFTITECNTEAERLVYFHRSDLIDEKAAEVFPGLNDKQIRKAMQQVYASGEPAYFPFIQLRPQKHGDWSELHLAKLPSEKLVMVLHDASQRKKEKEARKIKEEKEKKKGETQAVEQFELRLKKQQAGWKDFELELAGLFEILAGDLAAPLERIDNHSRSLLSTQSAHIDDQGKNDLIQIRAAEHRMKQLFKNLKTLEKISRQDLKPEKIDLSAMVRKKAAELKDGNPNRSAEFIIQDGLKDKGDPELIKIVIGHLLANAWNFTAKRGKTRIEFGQSTARDIPEYFIRDNGIGFPQTESETIFHPFTKLNPDDAFPGSGMGLALARRIIHRHYGTIRGEGKPGQGAVIYFSLFL